MHSGEWAARPDLQERRRERSRKQRASGYMIQYREANRERLRAYTREYDKAHATQRIAYKRKHAVERRSEFRRWQQANPEKNAEGASRYYARKMGAKVERVDYRAIIARDGYWCYLCNSSVQTDQLSFDHVVPLIRGGDHSMANLKVAHKLCNSRKKNRLVSECHWAAEWLAGAPKAIG
jgi:5-methylcytosine-specific restriction endonuclease McrA